MLNHIRAYVVNLQVGGSKNIQRQILEIEWQKIWNPLPQSHRQSGLHEAWKQVHKQQVRFENDLAAKFHMGTLSSAICKPILVYLLCKALNTEITLSSYEQEDKWIVVVVVHAYKCTGERKIIYIVELKGDQVIHVPYNELQMILKFATTMRPQTNFPLQKNHN